MIEQDIASLAERGIVPGAIVTWTTSDQTDAYATVTSISRQNITLTSFDGHREHYPVTMYRSHQDIAKNWHALNRWAVLNCAVTQLLGTYPTSDAARSAAQTHGKCSFPYHLSVAETINAHRAAN